MSGSNEKWVKRVRTGGAVTLAEIPKQEPKSESSKESQPLAPYLRLKREDISPVMEAAARAVAAVFPGTRIGYQGQWWPIKLP